MNTFSINKEAQEKIQRILNGVNYSDPVTVLIEMSNPNKLMDGIKKAFLEGKSEDDLIPMARMRFDQIKNRLTYRLMVVVYEKKDFKPEDLIKINGITFCMSVDMLKALQKYCLTFERGRFLLRSADNVLTNLQSITR